MLSCMIVYSKSVIQSSTNLFETSVITSSTYRVHHTARDDETWPAKLISTFPVCYARCQLHGEEMSIDEKLENGSDGSIVTTGEHEEPTEVD